MVSGFMSEQSAKTKGVYKMLELFLYAVAITILVSAILILLEDLK